jgi:hypothetical protein
MPLRLDQMPLGVRKEHASSSALLARNGEAVGAIIHRALVERPANL